jgi:hypothetical protein
MIDEEREPFVLPVFNDDAQTPMCCPVRVLDGGSVMVIAVVIAVVVIVVGRGEVDVRRRQDRRPDGGRHQNRDEERTPPAADAHPGIMRACRNPVNSKTLTPASRDGTGHVKRHYITIVRWGRDL